jgi:hypothetical protein
MKNKIDNAADISYYRAGGPLKKTALLILLFMLTLMLSGNTETYAPNSGHLKGFIYKPNGKTPLWGAQVILQDAKNNLVFRSNVTDSTGDYKMLNIPAGDYRVLIVARARPYKLKTIDFLMKITAKKTSTISFALQKSIKGLFFLLEPCCLATIVAGTAAGVTAGKLFPPKEQKKASPVIPQEK